ncbi:MAG TPA: flagellar hook-length control protein FliK [Candidatus Sulfotelmatobacter sp.]|nr:flagellar hook-length control protein FliK [Candidatus Sulfotelmatobacter sp.]
MAPVNSAADEAVASIFQDAKKLVSDSRQQLVQQITPRLPSAYSAPQTPAVRAAASADSGNGKTGNQDSNHSTANPPAPDSSRQAEVAAAANSPAHSDASSAAAQITQTADSAAATKAAGFFAASVEQSLHAPADAPAQSAGASAGSTESLPRPSEPAPNAAPTPLPQALPNSLGDVVKASELYQRVGGAEMHIAMQTDLFGSIDLRTVVHQSSLTATIGVQRGDVQSILANDLPALQHALADQKLHVEQISVLDNSIAGRMDLGSQSQQKQGSPGTQGALAALPQGMNAGNSDDFQSVAVDLAMIGEPPGLLSIRV